MPGIKSAARVSHTFFILLLLHFASSATAAQSVTLGWNPSTDASVVGYIVHYGTNSGQYSLQLDTSSQTVATLTNLQEGLTYYFAITAYDTNHVESAPSGEISYIVPGLLRLSATALPDGVMLLTFPVAPPHWYEIQASSDLISWSMVGQTPPATENVWMGFADFQGSALPQRFYRLVEH